MLASRARQAQPYAKIDAARVGSARVCERCARSPCATLQQAAAANILAEAPSHQRRAAKDYRENIMFARHRQLCAIIRVPIRHRRDAQMPYRRNESRTYVRTASTPPGTGRKDDIAKELPIDEISLHARDRQTRAKYFRPSRAQMCCRECTGDTSPRFTGGSQPRAFMRAARGKIATDSAATSRRAMAVRRTMTILSQQRCASGERYRRARYHHRTIPAKQGES